jgi:hypothetical protein
MNGKLESWHATDYADFDFYRFWKLPHKNTLGIGTWATLVQIHKAEIVEVRGAGRPMRAPEEQPVPRNKPQLSDENLWANAIDLMPMIDTNRDAVTGQWTKSAQGLDCGAPRGALERTAHGRIRFQNRLHAPDRRRTSIRYSQSRSSRAVVHQRTPRRRVGRLSLPDGRNMEGNNPTNVMGAWRVNQRHTSIVQVRKDRLTAFIDGDS